MSLSKKQVEALQVELNHFTKHSLLGVAPLIVDGKKQIATNRRIQQAKWWLGYQKRTATVDHRFRMRLRYPRRLKYSTVGELARAMKRRMSERRHFRRNQHKAHKTTGVGHFDGIPVANVAIPILEWCRAHGWHGRLVSGFRTPAYSRSLCYRLCGAPRCSGTCAGDASNHVGTTAARFAVDVSDYYTFRSVVSRCPLSPRIHNALPRDPVHFSPSGA
jgi:hypothetical protein